LLAKTLPINNILIYFILSTFLRNIHNREMTSKDANVALVGIRLGASNIVVAYFKVTLNISLIQKYPME
jgi:hypothetical protein